MCLGHSTRRSFSEEKTNTSLSSRPTSEKPSTPLTPPTPRLSSQGAAITELLGLRQNLTNSLEKLKGIKVA